MYRTSVMALVGVLAVAPLFAQPVDHRVRVGGGAGYHQDIQSAMLAASPLDRILVEPGTYPWFQFSVGVEVIGLGASPGEVVVERIAFHPSIPALDFRAVISNLTVRSQRPLDVLAIAGNEIAPGTLVIDGCILENGVSLRGGQTGFYVLINNTKIIPPPGHGFFDEAVRLGGPGNWVDLRNSRIRAWDEVPALGLSAGHALRILGGTRMRIDGCDISAGAAHTSARGGTAVLGTGSGNSVLTVTGQSRIRGGSSAFGPGGDGIRFAGSLALGHATVEGGLGQPSGLPVAQALVLPAEPGAELALTPVLAYAEGDVVVSAGTVVSLALDALPGSIGYLGLALAPDLPASSDFLCLDLETAVIVPSSAVSFAIPSIVAFTGPGPLLVAQGLAIDPVTGRYRLSHAVAARVAF